jgi:hypothetical protein
MTCACTILGQLNILHMGMQRGSWIEQMSHGLRNLDGGRTQRALLVFLVCAAFWIVIVWLCVRFI